MTKQYKGRTATIEIDEKNVISKSSGFFSSSKKTSLDKGTQRKTTENELPSLTQCTA